MPSNVRKINIKDAKVRTATVQIKNIVIDSRKMTLSVFRQIPNENIIDDETLQLKGTPWGLVNYFWPHNESDLHILWQSGQELRRSLNGKPYNNVYRAYHRLTDDPGTAYAMIKRGSSVFDFMDRYCKGWREEIPEPPDQNKWKTDDERCEVQRNIGEYRKIVLSHLHATANNAYNDFLRMHNKRMDLFNQLKGLEQLFIAV